ncbi:MAG TPA: orotidine-5'-phosphate decarboxylase [Stellaceae bacterium]|jgi:orotidine-5'-phosphate decarboxylase|nr:orotidine-5'-phosphate decarboxylase [Stellaceae bacterium]
MTHAIPVNERLIVALDVPTVDEARGLVRRLGAAVTFYKIGLQLQYAGGIDLARELKGQGKKIFLDAKLLDIDQTVTGATANIARLGVDFLTIHGHAPTLRAAVKGRGDSGLRLLAVTVLTSMGADDMAELGTRYTVAEMVLRRAQAALAAGCDGVIASGQEAGQIRAWAADKLLIVTPGIRSEGVAPDDQKRAATPRQAIAAGADYLVVGREILRHADPAAAAEAIRRQIASALSR